MIELTGLSPLQRELADRMWQMDSIDEIVAWVQSMPRSVALQAWVVMQMMIAAEIDQQDLCNMTETQDLINKIK